MVKFSSSSFGKPSRLSWKWYTYRYLGWHVRSWRAPKRSWNGLVPVSSHTFANNNTSWCSQQNAQNMLKTWKAINFLSSYKLEKLFSQFKTLKQNLKTKPCWLTLSKLQLYCEITIILCICFNTFHLFCTVHVHLFQLWRKFHISKALDMCKTITFERSNCALE